MPISTNNFKHLQKEKMMDIATITLILVAAPIVINIWGAICEMRDHLRGGGIAGGGKNDYPQIIAFYILKANGEADGTPRSYFSPKK